MADDNIPVNDAADNSPNPDNVKSETLTPYVPSDAGTYLDSKSALDSQAAQGTEPIDPEMQKVLDTTLGLGEGDSAALQIKTLFQNAEMRVSGSSQVANPDVQRILSATLGLFENVGGQPDFYSVDKKFVGIDGFGLSAKRTEGRLPSDSALGIGFRQIVAGALRGVEDPVRQAAIMRELQAEFSKSLQGNPNGWSVELQMVNGRPSLILERADKEGNPKFSDQYIPNETKTEFGSRFAQRFEFLTSNTFRQAFVKQALVGVLRGMPEAERSEFIAGFNDALTDSKYGPLSFSPTEGIKLITAEGEISAKPKPESGDKITFGSPPNHIEVTIPRNLNDIQAASYKSLIESLPQSGDVEANRAALLAQMPVIQRTLSDLSSQASLKALEKIGADGLPIYSEISGTEQSFVKAAAEINAIIAKSVGGNIRLDVNNSGRDFKFNLYENGNKVELPANLTPEQGVRFISIATEIAKIASGISPKEGLASIGESVAALYQELDDSSRKELLAKINPLVASKFGSTDYLFEPNQQGPGLQLIDWNLITSNEVLGRFGNSLESAQKPAAELSAQEINLELPSLLARSVAPDSTASEAAINRLKEIALSNPQLFATTMAQLEATAFDGSFQASRLQEQLKHVITKSPELADKIIPDLVKLSLGSTVEGQRANALLQDIQANNPDQRKKVLQSLLNLTGDTTYGAQAKQKFTDFMSTADILGRYELLSMISSAVSAPENYSAEGKPLESISHILDLTLTLAAAQESQRLFNDPVNRITQVLAQISDENGRKRFLDALTARALESTEPSLKKAFALQMSTLIGDAHAQALLTDFLKTVSTQPGALEKLGLSMQVDPATGERGVKLPARDGYEYFVSFGKTEGPDLAKVEQDLLSGTQEERLDAYRTLVAHLGTGRLKPDDLNPIIEKVNAAAGEDASKRLSFSTETNLLSLGDLTLKQFTLSGQDYTLPANLNQSQIELFQATIGNLISGRISQLPTNMSALLKDSSPEAVGAVLRELQNVIDEKLPADKKFTLEPHPLGLLKKGPQDAVQLFTADGRSVAVNGDEAVLSQTATAQILAKVNMLSAAIKNGAPLSTISDLISAIPPANRRMAEVLYSMSNGSGLRDTISTKYGADSQVAQITGLLDITEGQPLDTQFQTNYDQLIKAIQDRNTEIIGQILSSMAPSDRHRASALFEATSDFQATGSETKMLAAIKAATRSDIIAFLKIEAMLKSRDGETNLAGNARVALELIRANSTEDRLKGLRVMASLLAQMNSKDSERLLADFQTDYGLSFKNELASLNSLQLSSQYKEIFTSLLAGWDTLEAPVIAQLAEKAVMAGDIMVLGSIISGNRETTIEARNLLAQNQSFKRYVEEHFSGSDLTSAKDFLRDGRIALATVLEADYGSSWWKNPENSELTFKNATEQERKDYALGRELVLSGRAPANAQELAAKQFYERLTQVLTSKVDPVQAKVLEEILLQGDKSLFAGVAQQRYQGWWLLGIGAGSYKSNDIMSRVDNMTEKEWQALKDPVYFKFFTEALRSFTTPEEQARITALVQRKINAPRLSNDAGPPSFSDSQAVMRGINDFMLDYMQAGVTDLKSVAAHFQNMSNQEAALYKLNPQFRLQVDEFVKHKLSGDDVDTRAAKLLIDSILSQALSSGKAPVLSDVDKFLVARLTREVPAADDHAKRRIQALEQLNQLEALLPKGSELSARMLAVANGGGNEADRVLYDVFKSVMLADGYLPASRREVRTIGDTRLKALIDNGSVSGLLKVQLTGGLTSNYWNTGTMRELTRLSPEERATLKLSPELVKVLDNVIAQGEGRPADRVRTMVLNGAKFDQIMREFSALDAEQFAQMKAEYQSKYGSDLLSDTITGITKAEKPPGKAGAHYKFSPEKAEVLRNIIENNGVSLADRMRLFVIGNGENYREFQDILSSLDEAGRFALKADYFRRYKSNIEVQVIDKLPENPALREQFKNYFAVGQGSDNVQLFLNNMAEFSYLSVYDGTTLGRQRSLLIHGEELKDIHAVFMQLPRERQEEIARYYAETVKNNFESAEAKAQFITDMALLVITVAATAGVTVASGGILGPAAVAVLSKLSTAQLMAVSGAAFAAIRPTLATSLLDDSVPLTPEFLIKNGLMGALEGALVIPLGGLGGKAAIEVVQSGVTNVAEKATLSEAGKTLTAQALQAEMALKVAHLPAEQAGKLLQFANGDSALLNKLVELGSAGKETLVNTLLTLPQDHVNNLLNAAGQNSLLLEKLAAMPQGEAVKLLQASAGQPDQLMTALSQMNPQELVTAAGDNLTTLTKMINASPEMLAAAGNDLKLLAKMVNASPEMLAAAGNDFTQLAKLVRSLEANPRLLEAASNDEIMCKILLSDKTSLHALINDPAGQRALGKLTEILAADTSAVGREIYRNLISRIQFSRAELGRLDSAALNDRVVSLTEQISKTSDDAILTALQSELKDAIGIIDSRISEFTTGILKAAPGDVAALRTQALDFIKSLPASLQKDPIDFLKTIASNDPVASAAVAAQNILKNSSDDLLAFAQLQQNQYLDQALALIGRSRSDLNALTEKIASASNNALRNLETPKLNERIASLTEQISASASDDAIRTALQSELKDAIGIIDSRISEFTTGILNAAPGDVAALRTQALDFIKSLPASLQKDPIDFLKTIASNDPVASAAVAAQNILKNSSDDLLAFAQLQQNQYLDQALALIGRSRSDFNALTEKIASASNNALRNLEAPKLNERIASLTEQISKTSDDAIRTALQSELKDAIGIIDSRISEFTTGILNAAPGDVAALRTQALDFIKSLPASLQKDPIDFLKTIASNDPVASAAVAAQNILKNSSDDLLAFAQLQQNQYLDQALALIGRSRSDFNALTEKIASASNNALRNLEAPKLNERIASLTEQISASASDDAIRTALQSELKDAIGIIDSRISEFTTGILNAAPGDVAALRNQALDFIKSLPASLQKDPIDFLKTIASNDPVASAAIAAQNILKNSSDDLLAFAQLQQNQYLDQALALIGRSRSDFNALTEKIASASNNALRNLEAPKLNERIASLTEQISASASDDAIRTALQSELKDAIGIIDSRISEFTTGILNAAPGDVAALRNQALDFIKSLPASLQKDPIDFLKTIASNDPVASAAVAAQNILKNSSDDLLAFAQLQQNQYLDQALALIGRSRSDFNALTEKIASASNNALRNLEAPKLNERIASLTEQISASASDDAIRTALQSELKDAIGIIESRISEFTTGILKAAPGDVAALRTQALDFIKSLPASLQKDPIDFLKTIASNDPVASAAVAAHNILKNSSDDLLAFAQLQQNQYLDQALALIGRSRSDLNALTEKIASASNNALRNLEAPKLNDRIVSLTEQISASASDDAIRTALQSELKDAIGIIDSRISEFTTGILKAAPGDVAALRTQALDFIKSLPASLQKDPIDFLKTIASNDPVASAAIAAQNILKNSSDDLLAFAQLQQNQYLNQALALIGRSRSDLNALTEKIASASNNALRNLEAPKLNERIASLTEQISKTSDDAIRTALQSELKDAVTLRISKISSDISSIQAKILQSDLDDILALRNQALEAIKSLPKDNQLDASIAFLRAIADKDSFAKAATAALESVKGLDNAASLTDTILSKLATGSVDDFHHIHISALQSKIIAGIGETNVLRKQALEVVEQLSTGTKQARINLLTAIKENDPVAMAAIKLNELFEKVASGQLDLATFARLKTESQASSQFTDAFAALARNREEFDALLGRVLVDSTAALKKLSPDQLYASISELTSQIKAITAPIDQPIFDALKKQADDALKLLSTRNFDEATLESLRLKYFEALAGLGDQAAVDKLAVITLKENVLKGDLSATVTLEKKLDEIIARTKDPFDLVELQAEKLLLEAQRSDILRAMTAFDASGLKVTEALENLQGSLAQIRSLKAPVSKEFLDAYRSQALSILDAMSTKGSATEFAALRKQILESLQFNGDTVAEGFLKRDLLKEQMLNGDIAAASRLMREIDEEIARTVDKGTLAALKRDKDAVADFIATHKAPVERVVGPLHNESLENLDAQKLTDRIASLTEQISKTSDAAIRTALQRELDDAVALRISKISSDISSIQAKILQSNAGDVAALRKEALEAIATLPSNLQTDARIAFLRAIADKDSFAKAATTIDDIFKAASTTDGSFDLIALSKLRQHLQGQNLDEILSTLGRSQSDLASITDNVIASSLKSLQQLDSAALRARITSLTEQIVVSASDREMADALKREFANAMDSLTRKLVEGKLSTTEVAAIKEQTARALQALKSHLDPAEFTRLDNALRQTFSTLDNALAAEVVARGNAVATERMGAITSQIRAFKGTDFVDIRSQGLRVLKEAEGTVDAQTFARIRKEFLEALAAKNDRFAVNVLKRDALRARVANGEFDVITDIQSQVQKSLDSGVTNTDTIAFLRAESDAILEVSTRSTRLRTATTALERLPATADEVAVAAARREAEEALAAMKPHLNETAFSRLQSQIDQSLTRFNKPPVVKVVDDQVISDAQRTVVPASAEVPPIGQRITAITERLRAFNGKPKDLAVLRDDALKVLDDAAASNVDAVALASARKEVLELLAAQNDEYATRALKRLLLREEAEKGKLNPLARLEDDLVKHITSTRTRIAALERKGAAAQADLLIERRILAALEREQLEAAALRTTLVASVIPKPIASVVGTGVRAVEHARDRFAADYPEKPIEEIPLDLVPSAAIMEMARVRLGEGPWHSAERILASDGKPHTVAEIWALTRAIQATYKMDNGSSDMSGLPVNYYFVTPDNFGALVNAVQDENIKYILLNLAN